MKRIVFFLAFIGLAGVASAQETYSVGANANQVANLSAIVSASNARTCLRLLATESCTQANACVAAGAAGGSSCTAAQARAANARIFPLTQAGREEYVTFMFVAPQFISALNEPVAFEFERACANWQAFNQTQRDSACTSLGRAAGCRLCP